MTTYIYAIATSEIDGSRTEAKFIGDQVGVRMFVKGEGRGTVEIAGEWRGASIVDRKVAGIHHLEFSGVDEPLPFTLEHWGGCHCHHVLKRFRPPVWADA